MKRYNVNFADSAKEDISLSFEWGCTEWSELQAQRWVRNLRDSVQKLLKIFPLAQPLAPESEDMPFEIRQVIVGRYRVLFIVEGSMVTVLHVRGAFVEQITDPIPDESDY